MGRRSQPRDANITAAANAGKTPKALDSKLSIEGFFAGPPHPPETYEKAKRAVTKVKLNAEKAGGVYGELGPIADVFRALGLAPYGRKPVAEDAPDPADPRTYTCPSCDSKPGRLCVGKSGRSHGDSHIARRRLAEQHTEEAAA